MARRWTFLSNGHGEDAIAARLAEALRKARIDLELCAYPIVGVGEAYEQSGIRVLGPRRAWPSGGLTFHSFKLLWADVRAGLLSLTAQQMRALRRLESEVLVVVGDVYALALSSLVKTERRFYLQPLISAYHQGGVVRPHRLFMERFTAFERMLMRRLAARVYVRDEPTAALLRRLGVAHAVSLGNPAVDAVHGVAPPCELLELGGVRVALLPGSRRHARQALVALLEALAYWPEATGMIAWSGGSLPTALPDGWQRVEVSPGRVGFEAVYCRGAQRAYLVRGHFAEILSASQLVLGVAGTAHEQAASLGRPVVSFPLPPFHSRAFLANQQRLLGEALTVTRTPAEAAEALRALWQDKARYARAAKAGPARMGGPGGSRAIVVDMLERAILY